MSFWRQVEIAGELGRAYPWLMAGEIALALVLAAARPQARSRLRACVLLLLASLLAILLCAGVLSYSPGESGIFWFQLLQFLAQILYAIGTIEIGGTLLFRVLLPRIGLTPPPILLDVLFGLAYVVALLVLLGHHGVNLSGIVATSAVLTAVLGFSLQDTLGNVMGGVSLQAERSIAVGDWIRVGEMEGVVRETRWRQTSIETRDWDTVIIPNSTLMKSVVTVMGRRRGSLRLHRALVAFHVAFRHSPDEVIAAMHRSLQGVTIPNVAVDPPPLCLLNEFSDGYSSYVINYWTADFARVPQTSSEIRRRIVLALQRAGLSLAVPSQHVSLTQDSGEREARSHREELDRRVAALEVVEMLAPLNEQERLDVAKTLTAAPFRRGEVISRQGEAADYLYMLTEGEANVRVTNAGGASSPVATLRAGDVFGEMGMMTGQPRTATVQARTDVVCYRLDKAAFKATLERRPEIAEAISSRLAKRKLELEGVVVGLDAEALQTEVSQTETDMLRRIRNFFLLT